MHWPLHSFTEKTANSGGSCGVQVFEWGVAGAKQRWKPLLYRNCRTVVVVWWSAAWISRTSSALLGSSLSLSSIWHTRGRDISVRQANQGCLHEHVMCTHVSIPVKFSKYTYSSRIDFFRALCVSSNPLVIRYSACRSRLHSCWHDRTVL